VNDAKALGEIQWLARLDRIVITPHAGRRMDERGATEADVRNALLTATVAFARPTATTGASRAALTSAAMT